MTMPRCSAYQARSATGSCARKKTPPTPSTASPTDPLPRPADELGEDVAMRAELRDALVLALGGVCLRDREVGRCADLLGDWTDPLDQRFDARSSRDDLAALEVDEPVREPVPDRTPHVFLDQMAGQVRQRLAFIDRAREARRQGIDQRRERLRITDVWLCV